MYFFLKKNVQPAHLDIKKVHGAHPALMLARKMLRRISDLRAPQVKVLKKIKQIDDNYNNNHTALVIN